MTDYVLVGGGAFAREILGWFTPDLPPGDRFVGYLDDGDNPLRALGYDLPQLGRIIDFKPAPSHRLVIALASPAGKAAVVATLRQAGGQFATLIHSRAWVTRTATIGTGVVICPFADISANTRLGDFTTVNGHSSLGHDAQLGDYGTLSAYVDLTGRVKVGAMCFFGSGARVLPGVSIGEGCIIGAGAVVVRNTTPGATYYAAPARKL
jgi:sugar O-acyltransferase (sialic acid O-acetyltransferase NeuD family)